MRAATIHAYGGPEVLRIEDIAPPAVGRRDVLIDVHAASVNPVDVKLRSGVQRAVVRYRLPVVLGLDLSGVVVAVGTDVTRFAPGDEVFASPTHRRQGTYAELVAVDEAELAHKPARLSHVEAASLPLVGETAWQCLITAAKLAPGERVFIQAGSGGVGTFAIQLAKHVGATVATTCSTRNVELVQRLGADIVVDYTCERYDDILHDYDVVLDSLGGRDAYRARRLLRRGGRLVSIASGLPDAVARRGAYLGTALTACRLAWFAMTSRWLGKSASLVIRKPDGGQLARIAALVDAGAIQPVVSQTFPLEEVAAAHRALETGRTRGKIVLALKP